jgi:hypothetical protein
LKSPGGIQRLKRDFLKPIADWVFDGVIDFDFMLDLRDGKLPDNVAIYEFFCKAGANLKTLITR